MCFYSDFFYSLILLVNKFCIIFQPQHLVECATSYSFEDFKSINKINYDKEDMIEVIVCWKLHAAIR